MFEFLRGKKQNDDWKKEYTEELEFPGRFAKGVAKAMETLEKSKYYVVEISPKTKQRLVANSGHLWDNVYGLKIIVSNEHLFDVFQIREATEYEAIRYVIPDRELLTQIYFKLDNLKATVTEVR